MRTEALRPIHPSFRAKIEQQPYEVELDGLALIVERDVFPPDLGLCARNMAYFASSYMPNAALDVGCGTGYLALAMRRAGVPEVWASDIHRPAVECARRNVERNPRFAPVTVVESDVLDAIPSTLRFGLIVFNQPYDPGPPERVCGCGTDGGREITDRFLRAAPAHLTDDGVLLMSFSDRADARHDPKHIATDLAYSVRTLLEARYDESTNFIYEIRPHE